MLLLRNMTVHYFTEGSSSKMLGYHGDVLLLKQKRREQMKCFISDASFFSGHFHTDSSDQSDIVDAATSKVNVLAHSLAEPA